VLRRWRLVLLTVVVCLALATAYLLVARRLYEARVQLLVIQQRGQSLNVGNPDPTRPSEVIDDYIPTQSAIIRSPVAVERAIAWVGLEILPPLQAAEQTGLDPVDVAIDAYLKVTRPERLAKVLQIEYRAGSPEEAVRMVAAIAASYTKFLEES